MDDYESIKREINSFSTERLIELVSDPLNQGLEESAVALSILINRDPEITIDLGIKLLVTNGGDDYMQASVWDFIIDLAPERVVDAMSKRKAFIGNNTLAAILVEDEVWLYFEDMTTIPRTFVELIINSYQALHRARHIPYNTISDEELQAGYEEFLRRVGKA